MKHQKPRDEENKGKNNGSNSIKMNNNMKKKKRLSGGGLPLEAFANAKTKGDFYNPSIISTFFFFSFILIKFQSFFLL